MMAARAIIEIRAKRMATSAAGCFAGEYQPKVAVAV
jgi:hypothetical protein